MFSFLTRTTQSTCSPVLFFLFHLINIKIYSSGSTLDVVAEIWEYDNKYKKNSQMSFELFWIDLQNKA